MAGEALLLPLGGVPAGAGRPHQLQHPQAAHGHRRVRRGQLHGVTSPAGRAT